MRCHYEVLELPKNATDDELKKAYRRLALRYHPDKNAHDVHAATEAFKEIQSAHAVLSDKHERAWYDAHREAILRGSSGVAADAADGSRSRTAEDDDFDLWAFFSSSAYQGFGDDAGSFYAVYARVFAELDAAELANTAAGAPARATAPEFGTSDASWPHVRTFYAHWEGFSSVRAFAGADVYDTRTAPNRQARRAMEKENTKARAEAKRAACECVRKLVGYVRKRDPRVATHLAAQEEARQAKSAAADEERRRKQQEYDAKREAEARERGAAWDDEEQRELDALLAQHDADDAAAARRGGRRKARKGRRADVFVEVEAAAALEATSAGSLGDDVGHVADPPDEAQRVADQLDPSSSHDDEVADVGVDDPDALFCAACNKRFKNVKQWENHERSKKHQNMVRQLRAQLEEEDDLVAALEENAVEAAKARGGQQVPPRAFKKEGPKHRLGVNGGEERADAADQDAMTHAEVPNHHDEHVDAVLAHQIREANLDRDLVPAAVPLKPRKGKRRAAKQEAVRTDPALTCTVCGVCFGSRSQMFRHIESEGHAAPRA